MKLMHLFRTCAKASYRLAARLCTLDVVHLMILHRSDVGESPASQDLEASFLTPSDIRRFAANARYGLHASMAARLTLPQNHCVGILAPGGNLASYAWFTTGGIETDGGDAFSAGTALSFPSQLAFADHSYTDSAYVGRGMDRVMQRFALNQLWHRAGVKAIITTTDWTDDDTLKTRYATGFRYIGHVIKIGWQQCVWGVYPAVAAQYGIRFGQPATCTAAAS